MSFRLSEEAAWDRISASHTGLLTTLRRDGRPVTLPIWFVVLDRAIFLRTPARSKKITRIGNDPRGFFLVESGEAWADLTAVTLAVTASVVGDAELAARADAAIDAKYADHILPPERMPAPVRAAYGDMAVLRLDPAGPLNSWNNRALVGAEPQENA